MLKSKQELNLYETIHVLKKAQSKIRLINKLLVKSANYIRRSKQSDNQSHCCDQQQDKNHEVSEECYHYDNIDYWKTDCLKWLETTADKEHLKKKWLDNNKD